MVPRGSNDPTLALARRARARDAGLARLQRLTALSVAGATALAGVFAGLAASAAPGRKAARTVAAAPSTPLVVRRAAPARARRRVTRTPAAVPVTTTTTAPAPAPAPAPPVQMPTPVQQPPVVVSGGS